MEINNVHQQFSKVVSEIKKLNQLLGRECSNVYFDDSNPNDKFLFNEFTEAQNLLMQVAKKMDYLDLEVYIEGELYLNENGRFSLEDHELTGGSKIEIFNPKDNCWYLSQIEHNGEHYYCVAVGKNKNIEGYKARLRPKTIF